MAWWTERLPEGVNQLNEEDWLKTETEAKKRDVLWILGQYASIADVYDGNREVRMKLELPLSESELAEIRAMKDYVNELFNGKKVDVEIIENEPSKDYLNVRTPDYAKTMRTTLRLNLESDNEKVVLSNIDGCKTKFTIADKKKFKKQPCVEFYLYKMIDNKGRIRYSLLASWSGVFFRLYREKTFYLFSPETHCVSYETISEVIENMLIPALQDTKNYLWNAMV